MQYREVGNTGIKISALGFGTMRFASRENAAEIIRHGLPLGLNYFDIGPAYKWASFDENAETWTGAAIAGVPRDQMVLSSKAQPRPGEARVDLGLGLNTRDQMWKSIENSLQRVGVDWFDFYQLWDMSNAEAFEAGCGGSDSPLQAMREAQDQGLVKHLGFTFHGKPEEAIAWLKQVPEFRTVTLYYNFNDRDSERLIDYCHENGIGITVMGPLRGGLLVGQSELFAKAMPELAGLPIQEIALRFLLGNPGVTNVISGMNEIAHLEENAKVASLADPMSADQRQRFVDAFMEFSKGEGLCTRCNYCAGTCPSNLPVSNSMFQYQLREIFGIKTADEDIAKLHDAANDPANCTACGTCVEACPQKLPIPDRMEKLAAIAADLAKAGS